MARGPLASPGAVREESQQFVAFQRKLRLFREKYVGLWQAAGPATGGFGLRQSRTQQRLNETSTDELLGIFEHRLVKAARGNGGRNDRQASLRDPAIEFAKTCLRLPQKQLDILLSRGYIEVTQAFLSRAGRFQPEMDLADAFQALRNVWIANNIQIFLNRPVLLSPSIFGYSMLYPLTDNFLDSPAVSRESKAELSCRLKERLAGRWITPATHLEGSIFDMVSCIEGEYPRTGFPEVYWSLLAIHEAQTKSLLQQNGSFRLNAGEILRLSAEKGGASVLTDGYLASGSLSAREAEFFFGYGVVLQLLDDLQDVSADLECGRRTLFAQTASTGQSLDGLARRLHGFVERFLGSANPFRRPEISVLRALIRRSLTGLLVQAVGLNRHHFSRRLVLELEPFSPWSFEFLHERRAELGERQARLSRKFRVLSDLGPILPSIGRHPASENSGSHARRCRTSMDGAPTKPPPGPGPPGPVLLE